MVEHDMTLTQSEIFQFINTVYKIAVEWEDSAKKNINKLHNVANYHFDCGISIFIRRRAKKSSIAPHPYKISVSPPVVPLPEPCANVVDRIGQRNPISTFYNSDPIMQTFSLKADECQI